MAIQKSIVNPDGIVTSYHRVVQVSSLINDSITIEVESYIDRSAREQQIAFMEAQKLGTEEGSVPYTSASFYVADYVESGMTVVQAYAYLKSLDKFSGAVDVFESGQ